ncbi:MAG: proteasome assembly chaperone family protein [Euryarchaeota archaeon]|nr:proteasome assembly chaperone family protein [Euryarchaeota archaeon]
MVDIQVRTFKEMELDGGTLITAVPSVGLASTIAATYMIVALATDQVAAFDSDEFPPLSMVYAHKPKFPARVYAVRGSSLGIFISEVPLPTKVHRPLGRKLLDWARERRVRRVVCLEGLPLSGEQAAGDINVWAVGSTEAANREIEAAGLPYLETGMVAGVAGVLLNEGRWAGYEVIALLTEARPYMPDAAAAAHLVQAADKLLPEVEIDLAPLLEQAKELEGHLQALKEQAKPVTGPTEAPSTLYR